MYDIFLAELIGTTVFLSVIILSVNAVSDSGKELAWLKIGLALSICILLVSSNSGGHLNPAVSFMFYLNKDISFSKFIVYIVAQLCGALIAWSYYNYIKTNYKL
jgi:glycerol uptake facilitator-like aquaporin